MVQKGAMKLQYISMNKRTTNILAKPLSKEKSVYFRDKLIMMENTSMSEREH